MNGPKAFQTTYEAENLDFDATHEYLCSTFPQLGAHRVSVGRKPALDAGSLIFKLYPSDIKVIILPKGPKHKIQVIWKDDKEKAVYHPKLLGYLVPSDQHKQVFLNPLHTTIIKVPYPGPEKFVLAWCSFKVKYSRVVSGFAGWFFGDWWERRAERKQHEKLKNKELEEKGFRRLDCDYEILTEEANLGPDEDSQERSWQIRKKWEEQFGLNETSTS